MGKKKQKDDASDAPPEAVPVESADADPLDVPPEEPTEPSTEPTEAAEPPTREEQAAEYLSLLQHTQAEFLNYRKRVAREKDDVRLAVAREWAARFLPVLDNLERALAAAEGTDDDAVDADALRQGVQMILTAVERALSQLGVEPIATAGERFDPDLHEAISMVPSADAEPGTILGEVQRGFHYLGRVLRAPQVLVAQAPPEAQTDAAADTAEA